MGDTQPRLTHTIASVLLLLIVFSWSGHLVAEAACVAPDRARTTQCNPGDTGSPVRGNPLGPCSSCHFSFLVPPVLSVFGHLQLIVMLIPTNPTEQTRNPAPLRLPPR